MSTGHTGHVGERDRAVDGVVLVHCCRWGLEEVKEAQALQPVALCGVERSHAGSKRCRTFANGKTKGRTRNRTEITRIRI
jgi:hypothetical protein